MIKTSCSGQERFVVVYGPHLYHYDDEYTCSIMMIIVTTFLLHPQPKLFDPSIVWRSVAVAC